METLSSIIVGIITWIICCAIEKGWKYLKSDADEGNNTYNSDWSPKQFRIMYYITLVLGSALFFISINVTFGPFIKAMVIALMVTSIFFNWCAAENLYQMLTQYRDEPEHDNGNNNN